MKGDERNWWSEETLKAFNRKTECLKDQYSNFTFHGGTVGLTDFFILSRAAVYLACVAAGRVTQSRVDSLRHRLRFTAHRNHF